MKKFLSIFVIVILLPIVSLSISKAGEPSEHIGEATVKFLAAFNSGNGAALAGLYSADAILYPPGGNRIDGRPAIQAFWQGAMDSGAKMNMLTTKEIFAGNNTASEVGVFVLNAPGENGTRNMVPGKYIVVWKRDGHTWQLHRDIWNTH